MAKRKPVKATYRKASTSLIQKGKKRNLSKVPTFKRQVAPSAAVQSFVGARNAITFKPSGRLLSSGSTERRRAVQRSKARARARR